MSARRKLMLATWTAPSEGNVLGVLTINAEPLKAFLDAAKSKGDRLTVTTIVAKATALAFRYSPGLNARLVNDVFIPKSSIDVSCLCMLEGGKDLCQSNPPAAAARASRSRSRSLCVLNVFCLCDYFDKTQRW